MSGWVYFTADKKEAVRIGWSEDPSQRIRTHERYGQKLLAIIPAEQKYEEEIHSFFQQFLLENRDKSTYAYAAVYPYVERLLQYRYATTTIQKAKIWSKVDFRLWEPRNVTAPLWEGKQATLFVTEGVQADVRDCYETPEEIIETCRKALGGNIDLDPCSTSMANERVKARNFYDYERNGLSLPWHGTIFINPPYGGKREPMAAKFTKKLIHEIELGNVTAAITVLNLQSWPTKWFPEVWKCANAHAVWNSRIDFIRPRTATGAKPYSSSKNGTIFSYFGHDPDCFVKAFQFHASVFQEWYQARGWNGEPNK